MKRARNTSTTETEFDEAVAHDRIVTFYSKSKDPDAKKLSNFHQPAEPLLIDGVKYATIEHRFQAAKYESSKCDDEKVAPPDFSTTAHMSAVQAKNKGSRKGMGSKWHLDVNLWNARRIEVMQTAISARFEQDAEFREIAIRFRKEHKLLLHFERGKDPFWGARVSENKSLVGSNKLGEIIMELADATEKDSSK